MLIHEMENKNKENKDQEPPEGGDSKEPQKERLEKHADAADHSTEKNTEPESAGKKADDADKPKEDAKPAGDAGDESTPSGAADTDAKAAGEAAAETGPAEGGAEDDYGQEYYYDDFYTESDDSSDLKPEPEEEEKDAGGPLIPDEPEDDQEDDEEEKPGKGKKKNDEKKMPFLEHLEELRWTLMRSLIAIFVGAIISFVFSKQIVNFLRLPSPADLKLVYLAPTEGFMIYIKVAIFSGLVVALPYVAYEFWKFVVPGLLAKERKLVPPIVFFTVLCFFIGGAFAYLVLIPFAMRFLLGFQTDYLEATITIGKYLGFVVTLILVFGVVFELPVLSFFLSKIGLLTPGFLRSKRRYGIATIFIVAALLTPPDIMTQLMLAFPLIALYEISILVSAAVAKRKTVEEEDDDDE